MCELLPDDVEKFIYFDPDTIIVDRIDELIDFMSLDEFDNSYASACLDSISFFKRAHGFRKEEKYYNTGIMLINISKWRQDGLQDIFFEAE